MLRSVTLGVQLTLTLTKTMWTNRHFLETASQRLEAARKRPRRLFCLLSRHAWCVGRSDRTSLDKFVLKKRKNLEKNIFSTKGHSTAAKAEERAKVSGWDHTSRHICCSVPASACGPTAGNLSRCRQAVAAAGSDCPTGCTPPSPGAPGGPEEGAEKRVPRLGACCQ
jgi:hypothetical protein